MHQHRNPRKRLSKPASPSNRRPEQPPPAPEPDPGPNLDCLLYALRDDLRRADAMITTAERQIEENWHDSDGNDRDEGDVEEEFDRILRRRMRVEYLVEAGKYAVRGALYTAQQIEAVVAAHRRGA